MIDKELLQDAVRIFDRLARDEADANSTLSDMWATLRDWGWDVDSLSIEDVAEVERVVLEKTGTEIENSPEIAPLLRR